MLWKWTKTIVWNNCQLLAVCAASMNTVCSTKTHLCITQTQSTLSLRSELDVAHMARLVLSVTVRSALPAEQQLTHHFPSWYQHTEASGQQLPDTDAVGVPLSLWLSRTTVISHDTSVTLRISISWAAPPLCVLTSVFWHRVPGAAAQVSFTACADNKLFKSVYIQRRTRENGGSVTLHNSSWSQLYKCFGSWFCFNSLLFRMSTSSSVRWVVSN